MRKTTSKPPEYLAQAKQLWHRGVDALESGQLNEAESLLRQAAEATPEDADARSHLAEALWQSGSHDEALAHAEAACRCEPTNSWAAVRAGQMRLAEGDAKMATEWAHSAIGLSCRCPEAWALRGRANQRLGNTEQALADLQQALRYAPNDTELLTDVALLYQARSEHRKCLTTLHQLLDCYPPGEEPAEVLALAGESYMAINRPVDAAENLRLASQRGTSGADFYYRLAEAEAACGKTDKAISDLDRALTFNQDHTPSQQLKARLASEPNNTIR